MSKLDDKSLYATLDVSDMLGHICAMPDHIEKSYFTPEMHKPSDFTPPSRGDLRQIVICGMGGSAISADIACSLYQHLIPITVVKDYVLPYIDEYTLVICISYSGNTAETLQCLQTAITKTKHIMAITSGGKLKDIVNSKYLWLEIPSGIPPRAAIGHLFTSLLVLLELCAIIPSQADEIHYIVAMLSDYKIMNSPQFPREINVAKVRAEFIFPKIPIIYGNNPIFAPLAYRWKCQINENAKLPAFYHTLPEMLHNEITAWESLLCKKQFVPIFLSFFEDDPQYVHFVETFQELTGFVHYNDTTYQKPLGTMRIYPSGKTTLHYIFDLIFQGDMLSYYLAILNNVDPTEISYINKIKMRTVDGRR